MLTRKQIEQAIEHFGSQLQIIVAIEELAELQKELTKFIRADNENPNADYDNESIIEEIADVLIMINQLMVIFEFKQEWIDSMIDLKVERLQNYLSSIDGEDCENNRYN